MGSPMVLEPGEVAVALPTFGTEVALLPGARLQVGVPRVGAFHGGVPATVVAERQSAGEYLPAILAFPGLLFLFLFLRLDSLPGGSRFRAVCTRARFLVSGQRPRQHEPFPAFARVRLGEGSAGVRVALLVRLESGDAGEVLPAFWTLQGVALLQLFQLLEEGVLAVAVGPLVGLERRLVAVALPAVQALEGLLPGLRLLVGVESYGSFRVAVAPLVCPELERVGENLSAVWTLEGHLRLLVACRGAAVKLLPPGAVLITQGRLVFGVQATSSVIWGPFFIPQGVYPQMRLAGVPLRKGLSTVLADEGPIPYKQKGEN